MRILSALVTSALLAAACGAGDGAAPGGDPEPTAPAPTLVPIDAPGCPLEQPVAVGEVAVAGIDTRSGELRWSFSTGDKEVRRLAIEDELLLVHFADTDLHAYSVATCESFWQLPDTRPDPLENATTVFAVTEASLDAIGGGALGLRFSVGWGPSAETDQVAMAVSDDRLVIVTAEGSGALFDAGSGSVVHDLDLGFEAATPAVASDPDGWVVAASTGYVASFAPGRPEPLWTAAVGDLGPVPPLLTPDQVVVAGADAVIALDRGDGTEVWRTPLTGPLSEMALDHAEVHVIDGTGAMHHLDPDDGSSVFVSTRDATATVVPAFADLSYLVFDGGTVTAYTLREQQAWTTTIPSWLEVERLAAGGNFLVLAGTAR